MIENVFALDPAREAALAEERKATAALRAEWCLMESNVGPRRFLLRYYFHRIEAEKTVLF